MNPIGFAVSRPHTVAVVAILTVLFSWLAFQAIPVQLKPTVDVPRITVTTTYRGASAVEVEEQVTRELEDVLQSVDGLVEMTSTSAENRSQITLEFAIGRNVQMAMVDVANKLNQIQPLPLEADEPVASISSSTDRDMVMWIVAKSHYSTFEVRRVIEDEVIARLERVEGVSSVFVAGGAEREIQIRIDPDRLVGRNVTIDDVLNALASGNRNLRGGTVETASRQFVVRTVGKAVAPEELERLIVLDTERGSVRLGEVAEVVDGPRERTGFLNMNGVPTIAMGVRRQVGSNVVEIVAELDRVLEDVLNPSFAGRGIDISLEPIYRETEYITKAMGFVKDNLLLGAVLAIGVLLVGLRSLRSILVIVATIPTSLIAVFLVMQVFDRSLNVISLAGIAFASGMVVDNAIVVLENIFRHLEMGKSPRQAAIDGGREVWGGVLASTLTTVAVFVPILVQRDESSQLFKDIALTISAAVAFSLVAALTIVPVLASLLYRRGRAIPAAERSKGKLSRLYGAFCLRLETHRPGDLGLKLGFVLLVAAASLASMRLAPPAEYLPTGNRNMIMFFATPLPGTRPEAVRDNFKRFEDFVMAQPEFERMFSVAGGFNGGGIILKDEFSDAASLENFQKRLFFGMTLPGFRSFVPVRSSIFRDPGKQFEVEISGPDFDTLESVAARVKARLEGMESVTSVRSSLVTGRPELHVKIDEDRAKDLGLDVAAVGRVVEVVVAGRRVSTMIDRGREVDITVIGPQWLVNSPEELESLTFLAPTGEVVALGSVATVMRTSGPESIRRLERERNVLLTVNIALDAPLESVLRTVEDEVFPGVFADLPSATYTLALGGSADKLKTTLDALTNGLGLSVLIIYLLLVSLFRSWLLPAVILVTVPLALSGGVLGIRLASWYSPGVAAFDVISMLGFVILAGLVVNNAILIVHQANNFRAEGMPARRALTESARSRLRPILMSVTTTVFGMLPLAMGGGAGAELYQGLGAVIVGGLVVSTLFTLFLVPVLISIGHDLGLNRRPALDPASEAIPAV